MPRLDRLVVGRIATLAGANGLGMVEALAIAGGVVVAAGSRGDVERLAGPGTPRLDLEPEDIALPGLTDAHLHLADAAKEASELDLADSPTLGEGLRLIAERHATLPAEAWLLGRGWRSDDWGRLPTADDLAGAAPGRRVALWQRDHHAIWASHEALADAAIGPGTDDPPGGVIVRGADGRPTGLLLEDASLLVADRVPPLGAAALVAAVPRLVDALLELGIVAVHDPATLVPDPGLERAFAAYRRLDEAGTLRIRVNASLRSEALDAAASLGLRSGRPLSGAPQPKARLGWLKLFADGTLGSRTAAMLEPFEREPDGSADPRLRRGMFRMPPERLVDLTARAAAQGIASQIHAIGDAAVRAALDALQATAGTLPLRPRVEHVQLVDPADVPRFAQLGVAASVQPGHLATDAPAARRAWGPRAERSAYAYRSLASSGALIPFGTDAPVESIDPWPGIALAVTRRSLAWPASDARPFGAREALSVGRALRGACLDAAIVAGRSDRGRLTAGARADMAVIPAIAIDAPTEPGGPLETARSRLTMIDGEVVFER